MVSEEQVRSKGSLGSWIVSMLGSGRLQIDFFLVETGRGEKRARN